MSEPAEVFTAHPDASAVAPSVVDSRPGFLATEVEPGAW